MQPVLIVHNNFSCFYYDHISHTHICISLTYSSCTQMEHQSYFNKHYIAHIHIYTCIICNSMAHRYLSEHAHFYYLNNFDSHTPCRKKLHKEESNCSIYNTEIRIDFETRKQSFSLRFFQYCYKKY